jgi:hypothetical protein
MTHGNIMEIVWDKMISNSSEAVTKDDIQNFLGNNHFYLDESIIEGIVNTKINQKMYGTLMM